MKNRRVFVGLTVLGLAGSMMGCTQDTARAPVLGTTGVLSARSPAGLAAGGSSPSGIPRHAIAPVAAASDTSTPADFQIGPYEVYPLPYEKGYVDTLAVGDVNGDRREDAVVTTILADNPGPETVHVFLQRSDGTLAAPIDIVYTQMTPWTGVAIADLDHDGVSDIVVGHAGGYDTGLTILRWKDGKFDKSDVVGMVDATDVVAVDMNGDGNQDIFAQSSMDGADVYYGDGRGGFFGIKHVSTPAYGYNSIDTGDFTGDGLADVAMVSEQGGPKIWVFPAQHSDTIAAPWIYDYSSTTHDPATGIALGDLDKDGLVDVVAPVTGQEIYVPGGVEVFYRGTGKSLKPGKLLAMVKPQAEAAVVGDLDGNGLPDIVTMLSGWSEVDYFLQHDDGFGSKLIAYTPAPTSHYRDHSLALGDLNGDGCLDIATADTGVNGLVVYPVRNCRPLHAVLPSEPRPRLQ